MDYAVILGEILLLLTVYRFPRLLRELLQKGTCLCTRARVRKPVMRQLKLMFFDITDLIRFLLATILVLATGVKAVEYVNRLGTCTSLKEARELAEDCVVS